MLAEDFHLVTLLTVDTRDIDHRHVHTDIPYVLRLLTVDETIAVTVAEMTVQTVGIADRNGCNHGVVLYLSLTTVSHRLTGRYTAQLQDGGLQRRHGGKDTVIAGIDTIEADAQTTHVHLALREVLDAGGVVHVSQDLMAEGGLQLLAARLGLRELLCFELQIPQVASSKAITDLQKLMSEIEDISCNNEWCHIKGKVPLNTSKDYASEVSSYTKGLGIFMVKPCGYQITKDGYSDNIRMNEKDKLLFMFQKSMSLK